MLTNLIHNYLPNTIPYEPSYEEMVYAKNNPYVGDLRKLLASGKIKVGTKPKTNMFKDLSKDLKILSETL